MKDKDPQAQGSATPNILKIGWRETGMIGVLAIGGWLGIVRGGAETAGATLGEPFLRAAGETGAATVSVAEATVGEVFDIATDNKPPQPLPNISHPYQRPELPNQPTQ